MRCGYCYKEGHNQRTCELKTETYKKYADRSRQQGETDSFWIREYDKRVSNVGTKKSNMTCGYCSETGHTRRTCVTMKSDKSVYQKHSESVLRIVHDYISDCPVGIGSLFTQSVDRWVNGEYTTQESTLVAVDFDVPKDLLTNDPCIFLDLMSPSTGHLTKVNLQSFVCNRGFRSSFNVVSLISASTGPISDDWVEKRIPSISELKEHPHFRRTGDKVTDTRSYSFEYLLAASEPRPPHMAEWEYKNRRHSWTEEGIRQQLHKSLSDH